jgi:hypothetical protein
MKNMSFAGLAIRIALLYCTLGGICDSMQAQSEIRFRLIHGTLVAVSLTAGAEGPFDFVLDTGADTTIVDPSISARLSLVSVGRVQQTTLASVQTLTRGIVPTLGAGAAQAENVPVIVQDLGELRKMDSRIVGVAGQNYLSHFNYLLDYQKHVVRIEAAGEIRDAIGGSRVAMETANNRMVVESEGQSGNRAKLRLRWERKSASCGRSRLVPVREQPRRFCGV